MDNTGYYYSHVSILAAAVIASSGPVLELGAGFGSTLMLHGLCGSLGRELTTLESDKQWILKFLNYGRSWHKIKFVENFKDLFEYKQSWGLAFIDHGNTGDLEMSLERGPSAIALQETPIIVLHDTCHPWLYQYDEAFKVFKYRWDWQVQSNDISPRTSVVSKTIDVARLFASFCL